MTENPYDILGVARDASPDEVKRAYRKKARENHPDLNPNDPSAAERMNKVNEAYDRIMNPEKYAAADARAERRSGGAGGRQPSGTAGQGGARYASGTWSTGPADGAGGGRSPYDWVEFSWDDLFGGAPWEQPAGAIHPEPSASDSAEFRAAIQAINANDFARATGILTAIPSTGRSARWHYLAAIASKGAGNTMLAYEQMRRARIMDPNNVDYQRAERAFAQRATAYERESQQQGFSTMTFDPSALCCCMLCGPTLCQPFLFCI